MINLDKPMYKALAEGIAYWRNRGYSWSDSQRIALAELARQFGWRPS